MLCIVTNDGYEIGWHVGDKRPEIWQPEDPKKPRRYVATVQADGHELDYIEAHFTNLPMALGTRVVTWEGDLARFIAANL